MFCVYLYFYFDLAIWPFGPCCDGGVDLKTYVTLSGGIKRWWTVSRLLGSIRRVGPFGWGLKLGLVFGFFGGSLTVVGWGRRPGTQQAQDLAKQLNLPYVALEDGFLRSFGTGDGFEPISLIVDDEGIYYDSRVSSALETRLNVVDDLFGEQLLDIESAFDRVVAEGLSKYNHAPVADFWGVGVGTGVSRVLVVDQTVGDMSVVCGEASAQTFEAMLDAACAENPNAVIYVKTHPEVTSGRKSGYLSSVLALWVVSERAVSERILVLREAVEPASLIRAMDRVYVVSSTMGFEALMLGKPVVCSGVPWYSGWGVTDDRQRCDRRVRTRTVKELFAAAYCHYPRYIDPVSHRQGSIHHAIDWLVHQKAMAKLLHGSHGWGRVFVFGFARWKAFNLKPLVALKTAQRFFVGGDKALKRHDPTASDSVMIWGADCPEGVARLVQQTPGLRVLRVEDGFLRSVGLGSDMIRPQSLVFDSRGLYFDASRPSDLEHLLEHGVYSDDDLQRAAHIRDLIVRFGLTKYNLESSVGVDWPSDKGPVLFVPGQVEDDASIRLGCVDVRTNLELLSAVRASYPQAWIVYKPHPDVVSGNRIGCVYLAGLEGLVDYVETRASVIDCIVGCDEVHTMTSLTGFDALLRGKKVVTYGQPFYAGWGLTIDRCLGGESFARRSRRLTLDQLVAGVLLRYPVYWDWDLRGFTTCEAVIQRLIEERSALQSSGALEGLRNGRVLRLLRKSRVLLKAWTTRL